MYKYRYIQETVNQSWGLGVTRIKCPGIKKKNINNENFFSSLFMLLLFFFLVCQETIAQSEWSKYVSQDIIEKYNVYNQPYRPFSRYCSTCEHPVAPCQSPKTQGLSRER